MDRDASVTSGGDKPAAATPFGSGLVWNLASLAFLALAGFVLNVVIGRRFGPEDLGLFNLCFALFIFLSQFGAFGLQFATLHVVAAHGEADRSVLARTILAALAAAAVSATVVALLGLALTPVFGSLFYDDRFAAAWAATVPGLWAFSINKVLFGIINGARQMRAFAVFQAIRYILMLAVLGALVIYGAGGTWLVLVFTISELVLLPALAWRVWAIAGGWPRGGLRKEMRQHIWFGARAFLSGAILELNTRVDVLFVGAIVSTAAAGVYSMALLVAEGVAQLLTVVRNSVNPVLTRSIEQRDFAGLLTFSRRIGAAVTVGMLVLSVIAVAAYPYFVRFVLADPRYDTGWLALSVLMAGLTLTAAAQAFGMVLTQAGRPALHTGAVAVVLAANALGNWLLVPSMGMLGAALATSLSYLVGAVLIWVMARRVLGLRLFF